MGWNPTRSVRARLIAAFLVLGLVPLLLVSIVAYRSAETSLIEGAGQRLEDVAFNAVDKLDRNLFERYGDVQAYALSAPARSMEPERVSTWIDTMMGVYTPIYKLMVVADLQGNIIAVNTVDLDGKPLPKTGALLGRNVANDAWFKEAVSGKIKDGASFVEDLHHDPLMAVVYGTANGADFAMSYTAPIKNEDGEIVGVWTNRFNWDVATQILDENAARAHESGMTTVELGLAAPGGQILASPNAASVLNGSYAGRAGVADPSAAAVGHKAGKTLGGEDGFEGWAQSVGYATYPGVKWTLVASQSRAEVLGPARHVGGLMLLTGLVAALAIIGGAWLVARPIEHSVRQVSAAASGLARGDLDQQVDVRSRDELGQMATAVREMIAYQQQIAGVAGRVAEGDLRVTVTPASERDVLGLAVSRMVARLGELLSETRASADGLADTSTMMENVTSEVAQTVGHVSMSVRKAADNAREQSVSMSAASRSVDELLIAIEQVARGAQEQAQDLTSASAQAEEMARGVERVANVAERVSESSKASHETAERGVFAVRDAVAGMSEIEKVVEIASARVTGLGALGDRIGSVVDTINEIAQQTNLLALNASIEAARAGEHGRGFAVVAGEVRKLAERSQRETQAIEELIREVRLGTEDAVRAMEDGVERVRTGSRKADEAGQALAEILAAVETTVGEVDEIAQASSVMMQGGRDVSDALLRLSAVVEQSSATAEEMTATADEVGRSVQGMAAGVEISTCDLESVAVSAEQMHAQMASIESRADQLAQTAAGLRALVTRFQLADSPAEQTAEVAATAAPARGRRPARERLAS